MNYSRRQLEALGEPLGESVTRLKPGGRIYGGGGGGGGSGTQTSVSELPEWARPYAQETLAKASTLTAQPQMAEYGGERIAGFSPDQLTAQQQARTMGPASQLGTATGLASAAGLGALSSEYQPGQFQNQFQAPGQYRPGQFSAYQTRAPSLQQFQMRAPDEVSAQTAQAAETRYNPRLQSFQMGPAERVSTQSFAQPGSAEAYMSPYMQSVVEKQQRDAMRQAGIAGTQLAGQATQAGAFGGSRFGLMEAERQRNLATQLGDIQATGSQAAFQQAQQQFNQEQQARLQAQQANQQAGLTVGGQNLAAQLGVQQLGTQTGLQTALANLGNRQQANMLNAQQGLQASLANQQAGLTTNQQNLAALLGVQQLGAGQNLQSQLANQQAGLQAQQMREQSRQFGAGQGLQAAGLGAQYGQAAQQLGEQSRQYGAGLGMQGLSTALQSAGTLGNLGQTQYGQQMGINQLLNQYGQQQQALRQQGLSQDYQDFLNEQNYPYKQLGFMSDMIRGLPLGQQTTSQMYQAPGSMLGQLGGIGMGLYGMSRAFGMKEGGLTYAEGGVTDDRNVEDILSKLSDVQLAQAKQAALNAQDQNQLQLIEQELAERASMRRGLGSAPINFEAMMPSEQSMARGGIVAFADEGLVQDPMLDMSGGLTPESMEMDRLRVEALKAKRAEEEDRKRMEFLKTAAPDIYNRKMAEKPVAKAEPAPKETVTAQPAPKTVPKAESKAPAKSISEAARIVTDVAKTQVPDDDVGKLYEDILAKMKSAPGPEAEALARMLNNAEKRAEDIKARGIGEALMKFGFGMAAGAAKPGVARRSGLAGALEAAAGAAPILGESMAENAKLQQAAEDNALKLRLESARYQSAVESGNKQLAATLAGSISQRNIQQATLQAQIEQNARANALKEKEIAGLAAYRQQAGQSAIQKIADDLQAADPKLDRRSALTEASRISGYSFRSEQSGELQRMALLAKLRAENPMYKVLETQLSMAKTPEQQAAIQQKLTDIEQRAFGKLGLPASSGVGSGSASQVLRFDSKGNPIQ